MSAEVLRRAATLMRERAEAASDGPWKRFGMAGVAGKDWEVVDERRVECECGEPVALVGCATNADAVHIASWDPVVALAVADLLEDGASYMEFLDREHPEEAASGNYGEFFLAVARAYLGGEE